MSSALLNSAGRHMFAKHIEQYRPTDPLYEEYTDDRGRVKRRKRVLPEGLSKRDLKILKSVNRRAHYLDRGFNLCGIRFGWTFIIGLIPGAGDAADAMLGYMLVIRKARQAEIPHWLLQRMFLNLAIGTSAGLVPVVGDVVLAVWRANWRNARLLEEYLRQRALGNIKAEEDAAAAAASGSGAASASGVDAGTHATGGAKEKRAAKPAAGPASHASTPPVAGASAPPAPERKTSSSSGGRWKVWRRSSGREKAATPQTPGGPARRDSRFVENIDTPPSQDA